jgi:hypothetical protein
MTDKVKAVIHEPVVDVETVFEVVKDELVERGISADAVTFSSGFERKGSEAWGTASVNTPGAALVYAGNAPCNFVVRKEGKRARVFKVCKDDTVNIKAIVEAMLG